MLLGSALISSVDCSWQAAVQQAKAALENPALVGEPRMHAPTSAQTNENLSPNPGFDMGAVRSARHGRVQGSALHSPRMHSWALHHTGVSSPFTLQQQFLGMCEHAAQGCCGTASTGTLQG